MTTRAGGAECRSVSTSERLRFLVTAGLSHRSDGAAYGESGTFKALNPPTGDGVRNSDALRDMKEILALAPRSDTSR